jgi:hypothetical protein
MAFMRGRPDVAEHGLNAGVGEDRVECGGEVRAAVADHELGPVRLAAEVPEKVTGLLGDPRARWMLGDTEDADAPGRVLDHGRTWAWVPSSRSTLKKSQARIASA